MWKTLRITSAVSDLGIGRDVARRVDHLGDHRELAVQRDRLVDRDIMGWVFYAMFRDLDASELMPAPRC